MAAPERKRFDAPDDTKTFDKARADVVNIAGGQVGMLTVEPGWRWTTHMKSVAGTELCEAAHLQYVLQGTIHALMADGTEIEFTAGDVVALPPGHDAWVVGDEPVVAIDWTGVSTWGGG